MANIVERTWHCVPPFHGPWDRAAFIVLVSTLLSAAQEALTALHILRSLSLPLLDRAEFACFFYRMMLLRRLTLQMAWWDASRHPPALCG